MTKPPGVLGDAAHIGGDTQCAENEESLPESESLFRGIFDNAAIGMAVVDATGKPVETNLAFQKMLGYSAAELRSIHFAQITHVDDVAIGVELYQELREGKRDRFQLEKRFYRKDGRLIWARVSISLLPGTHGGERLSLAVVEDITERRRAEEALRFLGEASVLLASSLDCEITLQSVARLAVPMLADCCIAEVLGGDGCLRLVAAAHIDPGKEELLHDMALGCPSLGNGPHALHEALSSGQPQAYPAIIDFLATAVARDAEHLRLIGEIGLQSAVVVPLVARGRTIGAISLMWGEQGQCCSPADLALVEELAHRAALAIDNARLYRASQEAIRARDEFLSVAAHELKTPLTSLRGFAQLALRRLDKEGAVDPSWIRRAVQVIDQQSEKLGRLLWLLLDVSRIEAGRLKLERQMTDVAGLVQGVVGTMQTTTARHTLSLSAPQPASALIDQLRMEQVVTNLLDNAIKYSPQGGQVEVEVSMPDCTTVRLRVRDHGVGIPAEHRQHIFSRFYQAHREPPFGGVGLGLYVSRHIVELHGGRIEAEFPVDGGTCFVVTLPAGAGHLSVPSGSEPNRSQPRQRPSDEAGSRP